MEAQKTPRSKDSSEKKESILGVSPYLISSYITDHSNENRMVLEHNQAHQSVEWNRGPRKKFQELQHLDSVKETNKQTSKNQALEKTQTLQQMVLENLISTNRKIKVFQLSFCKKINSKCINNFNIRPEILILLEKKFRNNFKVQARTFKKDLNSSGNKTKYRHVVLHEI